MLQWGCAVLYNTLQGDGGSPKPLCASQLMTPSLGISLG
jgi:hypothetical protein